MGLDQSRQWVAPPAADTDRSVEVAVSTERVEFGSCVSGSPRRSRPSDTRPAVAAATGGTLGQPHATTSNCVEPEGMGSTRFYSSAKTN